LGDQVDIELDKTANSSLYSISKEDKSCFALELNWKS
jgi:hypothetical protein